MFNIYKVFVGFFMFIPVTHAMEQITLLLNNHAFYLEVPISMKEYSQGLMYRHHLAESTGMIFLFDEKDVSKPAMWMKNTYISLDMIFIGSDYRIACILEHTQPLSLTVLSCEEPAIAVIELNAGEARKFRMIKGMEIKGNLILIK
jgi:uncharacterized protein